MSSKEVGIEEKSGKILRIESTTKLSGTLHRNIAQDQKKRKAKITSIVNEKEKALTLSMDSYSIFHGRIGLTIRVNDVESMLPILKWAGLSVTGINKKYNIIEGYTDLSSLTSYDELNTNNLLSIDVIYKPVSSIGLTTSHAVAVAAVAFFKYDTRIINFSWANHYFI